MSLQASPDSGPRGVLTGSKGRQGPTKGLELVCYGLRGAWYRGGSLRAVRPGACTVTLRRATSVRTHLRQWWRLRAYPDDGSARSARSAARTRGPPLGPPRAALQHSRHASPSQQGGVGRGATRRFKPSRPEGWLAGVAGRSRGLKSGVAARCAARSDGASWRWVQRLGRTGAGWRACSRCTR